MPVEGLGDVEIVDEADTVNRYVPELRGQGVQAIGVLMHEGGVIPGPDRRRPQRLRRPEGAVLDLNQRIDPAVDLLVNGTPTAPTLPAPGAGGRARLVTQAGSYGRWSPTSG